MVCTPVLMPDVLKATDKPGNACAGARTARRSRLPCHLYGFTLIELLVAISIMSVLAVLSWRGLDVMARTQAQTSLRADQLLTLQAGLTQWKVDLDALSLTPQVNPLDWDGRVLRLTRRTPTPGEGLLVVAWMRRTDAGGQWLRWQSPVLHTTGGWTDAWGGAGAWAQSAMTEDKARVVSITPLEEWQIFYFRGNAWTNPMSNAGRQTTPGSTLPGSQLVPLAVLPDGIRLVLVLPASQAISGKLTVDWVSPTLGGQKS